MGRRAILTAALVAVLVVGGCSNIDDDGVARTDGKLDVQGTIPGQPADATGDQVCAGITEDLIKAVIGDPYDTVAVERFTDFPSAGVNGFECRWEFSNAAGDTRSLRLDLLNFDGAPAGALDESWAGVQDTVGVLAEPVADLGDDALGASLPGLASVSARQGSWQATALNTSKGAVPQTPIAALAAVVEASLQAVI